jgi:hypothetical protein
VTFRRNTLISVAHTNVVPKDADRRTPYASAPIEARCGDFREGREAAGRHHAAGLQEIRRTVTDEAKEDS